MKALLSKSILVAVALLAAATWVLAQSQGDRPPGVDDAEALKQVPHTTDVASSDAASSCN